MEKQNKANNPSDHLGAVSFSCITACLFFYIAAISCQVFSKADKEEKESIWLIFLFSVPILIQLIGGLILYSKNREPNISAFHKFYLAVMTIGGCGQSFLWILYVAISKDTEINSGFALVIIAILVIAVVIMTIAAMIPLNSEEIIRSGGEENNRGFKKWLIEKIVSSKEKLLRLKAAASQESIIAVMLFFTTFLIISYLFGFAFAFHDKSQTHGNHALYAKEYFKNQDTIPSKRSDTAATSQGQNPPTPSDNLPQWTNTFDFDKGKAILAEEKNNPSVKTATISNNRPEMFDIANKMNENNRRLEEAVQQIKTITDKNFQARVILVGHADDTPSGGYYPSNYELAEARAHNLKHRLVEKLYEGSGNKWCNVEWICFSESNEPKKPMFDILLSSDGNKSNSERTVDVSIEAVSYTPQIPAPSNKPVENNATLKLLDYIYFANYTITTTGYGDIIPITDYAKFLCSLANICEVFFLVVFFNALLSLKENKAIPPNSLSSQNGSSKSQREIAQGESDANAAQKSEPLASTPPAKKAEREKPSLNPLTNGDEVSPPAKKPVRKV
ncbi:MAG: hypothetical protein HY231_05865 [Acidobacteria bacterium]|nr:hypothetical protein [Acidobacteriota bacterium]